MREGGTAEKLVTQGWCLSSLGLDPDEIDPDNGWTALHYSCWHGDSACAEVLVRLCWDTAKRSHAGQTARDLAEQQGHTHVVEMLGRLKLLSKFHAAAAAGDRKLVSRLLLNNQCDINDRKHLQKGV